MKKEYSATHIKFSINSLDTDKDQIKKMGNSEFSKQSPENNNKSVLPLEQKQQLSNNSSLPEESYIAAVNTKDDKTLCFIEPDITEFVPELYKYCKNPSFSSKYHCDSLYSIMFKAANHKIDDSHFKSSVKDFSFRPMSEEISYHVRQMMENREKLTTIIQTGHDFERVCEEFLNDTHALSNNKECVF